MKTEDEDGLQEEEEVGSSVAAGAGVTKSLSIQIPSSQSIKRQAGMLVTAKKAPGTQAHSLGNRRHRR